MENRKGIERGRDRKGVLLRLQIGFKRFPTRYAQDSIKLPMRFNTTRICQCPQTQTVNQLLSTATVKDINHTAHLVLSTVCLRNYLRQAILTLFTVVQSFSFNFCALFSNNVVGNFLRNIVHVKMSFANLFNCIQLCFLYFLTVFSLLLSFL